MELETIYTELEQANTLPLDQQADEFLYIYKELESIIAENRPLIDGKEVTIEALRDEVKKQININELGPKFQIIFFGKDEQLIRLTEEFTNEFIAYIGLKKKLDVLDAKRNITHRIPFLSNLIDEKGNFIPENIIKKLKSMSEEDKEKHLQTSFSEYIRYFYQKSIELYGSKLARASLKESYKLLQEKYSELASNIYSLLPEELLSEEEKYRILDDSYKDFARALITNLPEKLRKELVGSFREAEEKAEGKNDEILLQSSFSRFFESVADKARKELGQEGTERIFENAYSGVKRTYAAYPIFMQVLKSVPRGILEIERFNILSKDELEKVSKILKRTEVMKSEFTNIAAHELKTPIVPIKGFLNMMKKNPEKYGLNEKGLKFINICLSSAERLEDLVTDILDVSKLEAGEMKFEMKDVDLAPLLKNEIKQLSFLTKENNIALSLKVPKTMLVYGDSHRLSQAISNLVKNAIKFTEKGTVKINAKLAGNNIQVDVVDTGMGIRKEDMQRLFTKFFQGQDITTRKTRGTGLGLAISKEIIEKHKGKIWAESKGLGKGSTFSFSLPVKGSKQKGQEIKIINP
jgi:signal transduction histidine kinase